MLYTLVVYCGAPNRLLQEAAECVTIWLCQSYNAECTRCTLEPSTDWEILVQTELFIGSPIVIHVAQNTRHSIYIIYIWDKPKKLYIIETLYSNEILGWHISKFKTWSHMYIYSDNKTYFKKIPPYSWSRRVCRWAPASPPSAPLCAVPPCGPRGSGVRTWLVITWNRTLLFNTKQCSNAY